MMKQFNSTSCTIRRSHLEQIAVDAEQGGGQSTEQQRHAHRQRDVGHGVLLADVAHHRHVSAARAAAHLSCSDVSGPAAALTSAGASASPAARRPLLAAQVPRRLRLQAVQAVQGDTLGVVGALGEEHIVAHVVGHDVIDLLHSGGITM